ncbi:MAG: hypothetical protein WA936_00020 [Erythrobacter sp.]|uniref:hypothetical protein n=1 Tax=Erythrobacter sp. TaxID=1042 RepID=UPI003C74BEFA
MTRHIASLMRTSLVAGTALVLAAASPIAAQDADDAETAAMTEGEERLAEMLEGRVAGEPQNCIRQLPTERMTTIDGTAYVYGRGNTIYVQRTRNPEDIDRRDALVTRRFSGSQICRQDIVTKVDPVLGFFTGAVFFEDFVPYTRVEDDG